MDRQTCSTPICTLLRQQLLAESSLVAEEAERAALLGLWADLPTHLLVLSNAEPDSPGFGQRVSITTIGEDLVCYCLEQLTKGSARSFHLMLSTLTTSKPTSGLSFSFHPLPRLCFERNWRETDKELSKRLRGAQTLPFLVLPSPEEPLFPGYTGVSCNMMPFQMGNIDSLPVEFRGYWPLLCCCVPGNTDENKTLKSVVCNAKERGKIGFLTVDERELLPGETHRRPGLHCDSPGVSSSGILEPYYHHWGIGMLMGTKVEGGIYMASSLSDSSAVYNRLVDAKSVIDLEIDLESLRSEAKDCGTVSTSSTDSDSTLLLHSSPYHDPLLLIDEVTSSSVDEEKGGLSPLGGLNTVGRLGSLEHVRHLCGPPYRPKADEIVWMTDLTPHESLPVRDKVKRQFFRLVTSEVGLWFKDHSTPNPDPQWRPDESRTRIVHGNKFESL